MKRSDLKERLSNVGEPRILIVGDLIADRYVSGEVARISPEAPIPILNAKGFEERLGGAGNVAANLRAMDAGVDVVGVLGDDDAADGMLGMLEDIGADTSGCVRDETRPTTRKTRMMSGSQQMLRVDWEDASPISGEAFRRALGLLPERIARAQAVVLSDYGKGFLTPQVIEEVIAGARRAGVPVLVDPKGHDFTRYSGATLLTPNRKEAELAVGRRLSRVEDVAGAAMELIDTARLESIVVTLGSDGIFFRQKSGESGRIPAKARAVFDVTGAGDTVVAQLALYLGAGLDLETSVALANEAAAIVVGRLGTYAVSRPELIAHLKDTLPQHGKVLPREELPGAVAAWRRADKRVGFTNGCFDVLHVGHIEYLRFAASKADVLIVGVNDDASVRRLKGEERPLNTLVDRMQVLAALEMVDAVVAFGEDTPAKIIEEVSPDALIKGEDWADKGVVGREWVESHGGQVHLAPLIQDRSTTNLIAKARERGAPS